MLFGLFGPVEISFKTENKTFSVGETVSGSLGLKFRQTLNAKSLDLYLKKKLGGPRKSGGVYEMTFKKTIKPPLTKVLFLGEPALNMENLAIKSMKKISGYKVIAQKQIEGEKMYSNTGLPAVYAFDIKIPENAFEEELNAINLMKERKIVPEILLDKLKKVAKEVPLFLEAKLTTTDGKEITKKITIKVTAGV